MSALHRSDRNPILALLAENRREYGLAAALAVVLLLNMTGILRTVFGLDTALAVTVAAAYKTFHNSITALLEKRISADIALCIAVIAAIAAGEYLAAAEAMFIVMVGETLESFAAGRTEAEIERFVAAMPRVARLIKDGHEETVDVGTLAPGDVIAVRAGERISGDGVVELGCSSVDESPVTGESLPQDKAPGSEVYSGSLNGDGLLHVRVTRAGGDTKLARAIRLVEEAKESRAPVERLADHYAKFFLPALLLAGALTFYFSGSRTRTVAVLIVACPCALILATPTAMVAAIGGLARRGILVRGGEVLQRAAQVDTVVFDKTGTITEGSFEVVDIVARGRSQDEVLGLAAAAERGTTHALARAIVEEAARRNIGIPTASEVLAVPGRGVECRTGGQTIRAGNAAFVAGQQKLDDWTGIVQHADTMGATAVFVSENDILCGAILLRDKVREGAQTATAGLRAMGISHLVMLTGDRRASAAAIARQAGIEQIESELLPEDKLQRVREFTASGRHVAMLGDGINDAPALAASDVGIAVAGATDVTAEAAGVVYLPHSLERVSEFFEVSRHAMRTAWLNIILFAGIVNLLAVIVCATGKLGPIGAALTHQISSFCVMMNSLRLLYRGQLTLPGWRPRIPRIEWRRLMKPAFVAAGTFVVLNGIYTLRPDESGVIERFGKKSVPFSSPGLHYKLPWPVDRLTRISTRRVRVVEIGFRSNTAAAPVAEPASYEWNVQHRTGRFESRRDEALVLTGDQNMIELNATVHYDVEHPDSFLFRQLDGEATVRAAAESVIHGIAGSTTLDQLLTAGRTEIEARAQAELQKRMERYDTGVRVLRVRLEDVHPSTEVVDAFRDVSAAIEEKSRKISESEGYRNEQIALARGNAKAAIENAHKYAAGRVNRAAGDASRFGRQEVAYRDAPGPTETRLYLETMEQVLPAKKKLIVDRTGGRRHLLLVEDGVDIGPLVSAGTQR